MALFVHSENGYGILCIGLMHLAIFLGEYPYYSPGLVLVSFLEVGVPSLKINIFQRFKYR